MKWRTVECVDTQMMPACSAYVLVQLSAVLSISYVRGNNHTTISSVRVTHGIKTPGNTHRLTLSPVIFPATLGFLAFSAVVMGIAIVIVVVYRKKREYRLEQTTEDEKRQSTRRMSQTTHQPNNHNHRNSSSCSSEHWSDTNDFQTPSADLPGCILEATAADPQCLPPPPQQPSSSRQTGDVRSVSKAAYETIDPAIMVQLMSQPPPVYAQLLQTAPTSTDDDSGHPAAASRKASHNYKLTGKSSSSALSTLTAAGEALCAERDDGMVTSDKDSVVVDVLALMQRQPTLCAYLRQTS